jgi:hypothetical protein
MAPRVAVLRTCDKASAVLRFRCRLTQETSGNVVAANVFSDAVFPSSPSKKEQIEIEAPWERIV